MSTSILRASRGVGAEFGRHSLVTESIESIAEEMSVRYRPGDKPPRTPSGDESGGPATGRQCDKAKNSLQSLDDDVLPQEVPLRVFSFTDLQALGHLPRSSACSATLPDGSVCGRSHGDMIVEVDIHWDLAVKPIVMISHSWVEPSKGRPDNDKNRKWEIVCAGIRRLCCEHDHEPESMYVFLDWISIAQESFGTPIFDMYVQSLPAFIAQMSYVLIPLDSRLVLQDELRLDSENCPVQMNWAHYSQRGWCRLEMLAGRALEALGTELRVYRFDATWGEGRERLIQVPPYTPGSLGIMPSAPDAFFTCCQRDHWDNRTKTALVCDRTAVMEMESLFSNEVVTVSQARRSIFLMTAGDLLTIHPGLGGIEAVPATTFLQLDRIPKFGEGHSFSLEDADLSDKRIFYFSNRFWRPGVHPDISSGLKMRWMKRVLKMLCEQDGIDIDCAYVWQDYSSIDQDNNEMKKLGWSSLPGIIARSTYFIVFATDETGKSDGALERALIRKNIFVSRLMNSAGIYTATYTTKLVDLNSLLDMTLTPLQCCAINPDTYCTRQSPGTYVHEDPLCPWTGQLTDENDREIIRSQCERLLSAASKLQGDPTLRKRMVNRAQSVATSFSKVSREASIVSKRTEARSAPSKVGADVASTITNSRESSEMESGISGKALAVEVTDRPRARKKKKAVKKKSSKGLQSVDGPVGALESSS